MLKRQRKSRVECIAGAVLLAVIGVPGRAQTASAEIIIEHQGAVDPATEGFSRTVSGASQTGPVFDDQGHDAWHVSAAGMDRFHGGMLSAAQQAAALSRGWKMSGLIRVAAAPDTRGLVTMNLESIGGRRYDINVGLNSADQTFVRLNERILTNPLRGLGPTVLVPETTLGYHHYELVFDPSVQTADLFVDGVPLITDYAGHTNFVRPLGFYMGTYENHAGNYAIARFEILPEPTSSFGILAGITMCLIRRAHSRKRISQACDLERDRLRGKGTKLI